MRQRTLLCLLSLAILVLGAGCRTAESPTVEGRPSRAEETVSGNATVFAAASLTESFNEIGEAFTKKNPEASVNFNFGSSSSLATQIIEQGGADIFASADEANMKKATEKGLIEGQPEDFINNRLEIIVQPSNPKGIKGLPDLAKSDLKVILAAPEVPVGRYGAEALRKAGVTVKPVSQAVDVKGVVGPVTLGEADAGIVYSSDVKAAGDKATGVPIPDRLNVIAQYPIGVIRGSQNTQVARAFIDVVMSGEGQQILIDHGFTAGQ